MDLARIVHHAPHLLTLHTILINANTFKIINLAKSYNIWTSRKQPKMLPYAALNLIESSITWPAK